MGFDGGLETLEASHTGLGVTVVRIAYNGRQNGHCASIDVDERLRDNEFDDLLRTSVMGIRQAWPHRTHPPDQIVCDMIPPHVELQES